MLSSYAETGTPQLAENHAYGAPVWVWAPDHSSATATFKVSNPKVGPYEYTQFALSYQRKAYPMGLKYLSSTFEYRAGNQLKKASPHLDLTLFDWISQYALFVAYQLFPKKMMLCPISCFNRYFLFSSLSK